MPILKPAAAVPVGLNDPSGDARDQDRVDPLIWKMSVVVLLGPLMTNLDSTVVNVSLAKLAQDLRAPLNTIQWVTTGYLLALALALPLNGWLVDRIGAKRVYMICFTAFTVASMLCGTATSATMLVAFRVLQGMAGGLLAPMAQMMMARIAGRHLARVMGLMVVPILLSPIAGPTLAGIILQHASWRWLFFINLPVGVLAIILAAWLLPADSHETRSRPLDLLGFLLLSPGLALLMHATERLSAGPMKLGSHLEWLAALALIAGFVLHGRRLGPLALVDLRLFRHRRFSASALTQFLTNGIAFGGQMLLPLYLLLVRRVTPTQAGLLMAPAGLGMLCVMPVVGRLVERFGSRRVAVVGAVVALLGTLPFALGGLGLWPLRAAIFIRGAGLGAIGIPSIASAYSNLPQAEIPAATTAINIVQRLGGPVATMALAIFLHARLAASLQAQAFAAAFMLLCAIHGATVLAALRLPATARAE
jgi:EmrB/QacA subfamily drug resistance transporter